MLHWRQMKDNDNDGDSTVIIIKIKIHHYYQNTWVGTFA